MEENKLIFAGKAKDLDAHIKKIMADHETIGELDTPQMPWFSFETYDEPTAQELIDSAEDC